MQSSEEQDPREAIAITSGIFSATGTAKKANDYGLNSEEWRNLEAGGDFAKCVQLEEIDTIDREEGTNRLVENTIDLASNVTELAETHSELIFGRGCLLKKTIDLLNHIVEQCDEVESEQVELINYSIGNRQICNSLSKILLNLCQSVEPLNRMQACSQDVCVSENIGVTLVHVCRSIIDYELHSNLYTAMC